MNITQKFTFDVSEKTGEGCDSGKGEPPVLI
jgi:hypothetical protein